MKNIVIWETLPFIGGGQKIGLSVLDSLQEKYNCSYILPEKGMLSEELDRRKTPYAVIPIGYYKEGKKGISDILKFLLFFPKVYWNVRKHLKKNKVDLIYANGSRAFLWSALLGKSLHVSVVWHVHNFFEDDKTKALLNFFGKFLSVKKIVYVSHAVSKQFPDLINKSEVIYNGLNFELFLQKKNEFNVRKEFSIEEGKKIITLISRLSSAKKIETFLEAIPSIQKQLPATSFLIVGGEMKGDEEYATVLKQKVREMNLEDDVIFTGYCDNVVEILQQSDINCVTALETFSLVILEAAICGIPSIAPDVGGPKELIQDRKTGLLYKYGSCQDLTIKVVEILRDEKFYATMSNDCQEHAKNFDFKIFKKNISNTVEKLL